MKKFKNFKIVREAYQPRPQQDHEIYESILWEIEKSGLNYAVMHYYGPATAYRVIEKYAPPGTVEKVKQFIQLDEELKTILAAPEITTPVRRRRRF